MKTRITISRPPTLDRVMKYVGLLGRQEHFNEPMTSAESHMAAAVFFAANWAYRRDKLGKSWRGHTYTACKCFELHERVILSAPYVGANMVPDVDINF